jgi:SAM-dependent MidA family methyltransferase
MAELGPGRGTLMADVLRATRAVPGMHDGLAVHLVEASPRLRALQKAALESHAVSWHDRVGDLPEAPLFLLANEFLDALPIRQFERAADGWCERMVSMSGDGPALRLSPPHRLPELAGRLDDTRPGDVVELCPALPVIVGEVARRIARSGGVALFIDYGDWRSLGDTLQAVHKHKPVDILETPGQADLTAHVDFEAVARAALEAGAAVTEMVPQGELLDRLGISARAEALARSLTARGASAMALENHLAAHRRLTDPQEMGSLFKAIAIYPRDSPPPPGFRT